MSVVLVKNDDDDDDNNNNNNNNVRNSRIVIRIMFKLITSP